MDDALTAHVAATLGAVGAVLLLIGRTRLQLFAGFVALGLSQAGLALSLSGGLSLEDGVGAATVAVGLAGVVALAALTAVLVRWPQAVLPLVLLAAPFRLPLDVDRGHRFLLAVAESGELGRLLPLYVVLTAAVLATVLRLLRNGDPQPLPVWLAWPAAAFLAYASLSLLWTDELNAGTNVLLFFLNPFAALLAVAGRAPFPDWMPRALAGIAVGLGCLFAGVGLWQAATERLLFFAPRLEVANTYGSFFRVTSLFRDPSLYGRHVVAAIAVLLVALWLRRVNLWIGAALIAFLWAGLYFSYSQSSMVSLFGVALAVTAVAGDRVARLVVLAIAVFLVAAASAFLVAELQDESARRVTSDRSRRVEVTLDVVRDHPVAGVGLGAQPAASRARSERGGPDESFVSHTTPLTVAAELGIVGLLLYLALLAGAARTLWELWRRRPALGLALGAVLLALAVHSLFYSGFFEDPITWVVLAIASAALAAPVAAPPPAPTSEPRPELVATR
jgi:putative inorganic carbon (hco3(-)) transporter